MPAPLLDIDSPQNPKVKLWTALLEPRGLRKHGQYLLAGRKTVPEALARHPGRFTAVLTPDAEALDALPPLPASLIRYRLSRAAFNRVDASGTGFPLLLGEVPEMPEADLSAPPDGLEIICALSDPGNMGALMRSAAAFNAARLILMAEAAHPFHPQALRAAANAQYEIEFRRGPSWDALNAAAGPVYALDGSGWDITAFDWPRDVRLILGEEGQGLPAGLTVGRLAIPATDRVESLNATVAASLAVFLHYRQHR